MVCVEWIGPTQGPSIGFHGHSDEMSVSIKTRKVLTSTVMYNFSRKALLHGVRQRLLQSRCRSRCVCLRVAPDASTTPRASCSWALGPSPPHSLLPVGSNPIIRDFSVPPVSLPLQSYLEGVWAPCLLLQIERISVVKRYGLKVCTYTSGKKTSSLKGLWRLFTFKFCNYHNFGHYSSSRLLFKDTTFRRLDFVSVFKCNLLIWAQR
jgi:hypothetical protein